MQVHARFRLDEVTHIRMYGPNPDKTAQEKWVNIDGIRVKLYPVQGEPFGSATPGGELMMVIANPGAAAMFHDATLGQEFDVIFSPVEAPS